MNKEEKIKTALIRAYYEKENIKISRKWQTKTMHRIRILGTVSSNISEFMLEMFIWRFAAAACVLAFILSVYIFQTDFHTEYELARLFMNDPLEFSLVQSFGIL